MEHLKKRQFGPLWLWLVLTAGAVAATCFFSSQSGSVSDDLSLGLVKKLLSLFLPDASAVEMEFFNHILRKLAHFFLYWVLGCGLYGLLLRQDRLPQIPAALVLGAAYASLDEYHQSFVQGRTPGVRDVLIDSCGVLAGCAVIAALAQLSRELPADPGTGNASERAR